MSDVEITIPPAFSKEEAWICDNSPNKIRVEHRMTGSDTSEVYVHLSVVTGKEVCWHESTFNRIATLALSYRGVAEPKPGVREKVKARRDWEHKNAGELAEFIRLKKKFGGKS